MIISNHTGGIFMDIDINKAKDAAQEALGAVAKDDKIEIIGE